MEPNKSSGLRCPSCGARGLRVLNTHPYPERIVRYRECEACGHRLKSVEKIDFKNMGTNAQAKESSAN